MGQVTGNSKSGSGSGSSSGASTQLTVSASDEFELNDPVFMDWRTGAITNLNTTPVVPALTAGPATVAFASAEYVSQGYCSANAITLADGSLVTVVSNQNNTGQQTNDAQLMIHKYSAKGLLIGKSLVTNRGVASTISPLCIVLLSNGNIAVAYSYVYSDLTSGLWAIFSPTLQLLSAGALSGSNFHLQATNNGGFLSLNGGGIDFVSSNGVVTNRIANAFATGTYLGTQDELNGSAVTFENSACPGLVNYQPAQISGGGFGYFFATSTALLYVQFNADGSQRNTTTSLQTWSNQITYVVKFAVSTTGSIAWLVSSASVGYYGVISDTGVAVKLSTALAIAGSSPSLLMPDAGGGFVAFYPITGGWGVHCLTSVGATLAGFPLMAAAGAVTNVPAVTLKLSTGTVLISQLAAASYTYVYAFITLAGVVKTGVLYNFVSGAGQTTTAMVVNDTVYGAMTSGGGGGSALRGVPELVAFSINNAGVAVAAPSTWSAALSIAAGSLRIAMDPSAKLMYVVAGGLASTSLVGSYDLASLTLRQTYQTDRTLIKARIRSMGQGLLFLDSTDGPNTSGFKSNTTPPTFAVFIKAKSTVLLGVAAAKAAKGDPLLVNTKGVFAVSDPWAFAASTFDQTANNPPGNSGYINSRVINLKGF